MTKQEAIRVTETAQHPNVYAALCAAQAAMGPVRKGSVNPAFKSRYADLADVMSVALPALTDEGIAVFHQMIRDDAGMVMRTVLYHGATNTQVACDVPLIVAKNDMQGMKSATTYAKRIGIESLTGIAPEDDDGNAAAKALPRKEERRDLVDPLENMAEFARDVSEACAALETAESIGAMLEVWNRLAPSIRADGGVIRSKDKRKAELGKAA